MYMYAYYTTKFFVILSVSGIDHYIYRNSCIFMECKRRGWVKVQVLTKDMAIERLFTEGCIHLSNMFAKVIRTFIGSRVVCSIWCLQVDKTVNSEVVVLVLVHVHAIHKYWYLSWRLWSGCECLAAMCDVV